MGAAHCVFNVAYLALAVLSVGSGFSEANDWSDMFEEWKDAYTIRRFWG